MKISEIKSLIATLDPREGLRYLDSLDESEKIDKLRFKVIDELNRLKAMTKFELQVYKRGISNPAGLDEVGRGPLAGPVVAAAVILPKDYLVYGLNDSKKISEKKRNLLSSIIIRDALSYSIAEIDHLKIDKINILNASKEAMYNCVKKLKIRPGYLLIDAIHIEGTEIKQAGIVHGDERSISIAAASILAKVHRDSIMYEYDRIYPEYGFCRNKGYGTKEHIKALKKYGPCKIHRSSFIKNIV